MLTYFWLVIHSFTLLVQSQWISSPLNILCHLFGVKMNDPSCDAACATTNQSEISPIKMIDHQDVTPLTNNKSSDKVDRHVPAKDRETHPYDVQGHSNICVNLEDSIFSSDHPTNPNGTTTTTDQFNREFTSGRNCPFTANEGMLATWCPIPKTKNGDPPLLLLRLGSLVLPAHTLTWMILTSPLFLQTCNVNHVVLIMHSLALWLATLNIVYDMASNMCHLSSFSHLSTWSLMWAILSRHQQNTDRHQRLNFPSSKWLLTRDPACP